MARNIEFIPEEKIEKALGVFWEKGYMATSLADLVDAMEINRSSLYNSFKDKHNLFKVCLRTYEKMAELDFRATIDNMAFSSLEKVESIIDRVVQITVESNNSCLGITSSFELASNDREVQCLLKEGNDRTVGLIRSLIADAMECGEVKDSRNAEVMAHFVFSSFSGMRQSYIIYRDKELIRRLAGELKEYLRA
jgi:TetR/AcrR family transcriptional repressor of nem operon